MSATSLAPVIGRHKKDVRVIPLPRKQNCRGNNQSSQIPIVTEMRAQFDEDLLIVAFDSLQRQQDSFSVHDMNDEFLQKTAHVVNQSILTTLEIFANLDNVSFQPDQACSLFKMTEMADVISPQKDAPGNATRITAQPLKIPLVSLLTNQQTESGWYKGHASQYEIHIKLFPTDSKNQEEFLQWLLVDEVLSCGSSHPVYLEAITKINVRQSKGLWSLPLHYKCTKCPNQISLNVSVIVQISWTSSATDTVAPLDGEYSAHSTSLNSEAILRPTKTTYLFSTNGNVYRYTFNSARCFFCIHGNPEFETISDLSLHLDERHSCMKVLQHIDSTANAVTFTISLGSLIEGSTNSHFGCASPTSESLIKSTSRTTGKYVVSSRENDRSVEYQKLHSDPKGPQNLDISTKWHSMEPDVISKSTEANFRTSNEPSGDVDTFQSHNKSPASLQRVSHFEKSDLYNDPHTHAAASAEKGHNIPESRVKNHTSQMPRQIEPLHESENCTADYGWNLLTPSETELSSRASSSDRIQSTSLRYLPAVHPSVSSVTKTVKSQSRGELIRSPQSKIPESRRHKLAKTDTLNSPLRLPRHLTLQFAVPSHPRAKRFYTIMTKRPLSTGEKLFENRLDSDAVSLSYSQWLRRYHHRSLERHPLLSSAEKAFLKLLDNHLLEENLQGDRYMAQSVQRFVRKNLTRFLHDPEMAHTLRRKLGVMRAMTIIDDQCVVDCLRLIDGRNCLDEIGGIRTAKISDSVNCEDRVDSRQTAPIQRSRAFQFSEGDCGMCGRDVLDSTNAVFCSAKSCSRPLFHRGCVAPSAADDAQIQPQELATQEYLCTKCLPEV